MKAISIQQPWAHAILKLGKRVENRGWKQRAYRGPILLHASKTLRLEDFDAAVERILEIIKPAPGAERFDLLAPLAQCRVALRGKHRGKALYHPAPELRLGGIVGRARIVDVIDPSRGQPLVPLMRFGRAQPPPEAWYTGGFALVLDDVEPLPFIPWKGSLSFFDVPDEIVQQAIDAEPWVDRKLRDPEFRRLVEEEKAKREAEDRARLGPVAELEKRLC